MSSTMQLDERTWEFFKDSKEHVKGIVEKALHRIDWSVPITWTRLAGRRGAGAGDATCIEVWCAKLADIEPEVRICRSAYDSEAEMVDKFAATFEAFRSGNPPPVTSN